MILLHNSIIIIFFDFHQIHVLIIFKEKYFITYFLRVWMVLKKKNIIIIMVSL